MDKDIHDIYIDGEKIDKIVLDDNDSDSLDNSAVENNLSEDDEKTETIEEGVSDEINEKDDVDEKQITNIESSDEEDDDPSPTESLDEPAYIENRKKKLRSLRFAVSIPAILIIIAGMIALFIISERNERYENLLNVDFFYEGIFVDDISLGGLTYDEAYEKLKALNEKKADNISINLVWDDEKIEFTKDDVDYSVNTEEVLERAWQDGREGEDAERYDYVLSLIDNPKKYSTEMKIDPSEIEPKVKAIALFRQKEPGEASVQFNPSADTDGSEWFEYSEPEKGIKTDPDELWAAVMLETSKNLEAVIDIPKWEVDPTTTIEDLKDMTQMIVQFKSTMVKSSNREHNVRLACSMINGTVLMPGEIFSMNDTTGKRTKAAGYKEANVIVSGNQLVPGIAGGVCQVSGTLFNAAVRADLEIVERHHHSFELSYLTRGRDATVNYGTADLRFKNTSDHPIYISMYTVGRDVYAEIYGVPLENGMTIELYVKTTQTVSPGPTVYVADSSIPAWESPKVYSARTGIKCTTYKDYYDADGKLIDRVELHSDYYRPFPLEVHYNPTVGKPS